MRRLAATAAILLLTLVGCESDTTVAPDPIGGWIEGAITDGGEDGLGGVDMRLWHRPWGGDWMLVEFQTDADGYYCIGLPDGEAVIKAYGYKPMWYREGGPTYDVDEADTILVDGGVRRADFSCGQLRLVADEQPADPEFWDYANIVIPPLEGGGWGSVQALFGSNWGGFEGDDEVSATFRFVLPGQYAVRNEPVGVWEGYFLPGTYRGSEAGSYTVNAGEVTTIVSTRPEPVVLRGRIEGSWEEFGLVPWIRARIADGWPLGHWDCDADGRFEIELPAGGDFELNVHMHDTTDVHSSLDHWMASYATGEAQVISVENGDTSEEIVVQVGGLEIELVGDPAMTQALIEVQDESGETVVDGYCLDRDPFPVRIGNVLPGSYRLRITTNGSAITCDHGGSLTMETPGTVEVAGGEITRITVPLTAGGSIPGQILMADGGTPHGCFYMAIHAVDDRYDPLSEYWSCNSGYHQFDYDDETGDFAIRGLAPGSYKLRVLVDGAEQWLWYPGVVDWDDATAVTVPDGGDAQWLQWTVSLPAP